MSRPATTAPANQRNLPRLTPSEVRFMQSICTAFYSRDDSGMSSFDVVRSFLDTLMDPAMVDVRNEGVEGVEVEYGLEAKLLQNASNAVVAIQEVLNRLQEVRHSEARIIDRQGRLISILTSSRSHLMIYRAWNILRSRLGAALRYIDNVYNNRPDHHGIYSPATTANDLYTDDANAPSEEYLARYTLSTNFDLNLLSTESRQIISRVRRSHVIRRQPIVGSDLPIEQCTQSGVLNG